MANIVSWINVKEDCSVCSVGVVDGLSDFWRFSDDFCAGGGVATKVVLGGTFFPVFRMVDVIVAISFRMSFCSLMVLSTFLQTIIQ